VRKNKVHDDNVSKAITLLRRAVAVALKDSSKPASKGSGNTTPGGSEPSIPSLCNFLRKTYPVLLKGAYSPNGEGHMSVVVAEISQLFLHLLGRLHKLCLEETVRQDAQEKSRARKARANTRIPQKDISLQKENHDSSCQALATLLVHMVLELDTRTRAGQLLLEALICGFLDHIGSSLSLVVFADPSVSSLDGLGLLPPRGLLDVEHVTTGSALTTAHNEAPYLVYILGKVMEYLDKIAVTSNREGAPLLSIANDGLADSSSFGRRLRDKLQNTLLRGVFGDGDNAFTAGLNRIDGVEDGDISALFEALKQEEDTSEWFIGRLWELLGWDILKD